MNTLVIVLVAAVVLIAAYTLYGRWLANKWGIDPKAQTPAVKFNDGKDFVPTNGWTVFSHQFSSIAVGADRWRVLRRRHRLRRAVCLREKRRQIHGYAD